MGIGTSLTPGVNLISSSLLTAGADSDLAEVVAMGKQGTNFRSGVNHSL